MIVATVIHELIETKLAHGAAHKGLEQLCQSVQRATSALRSVDAEAGLQHDQRLISALLAKENSGKFKKI